VFQKYGKDAIPLSFIKIQLIIFDMHNFEGQNLHVLAGRAANTLDSRMRFRTDESIIATSAVEVL